MRIQRLALSGTRELVEGAFHANILSPHRNPVPPPKLAADAPVLNVAHPVVIDFRPALRIKLHRTRGDAGAGFLDAWILEKPLFAEPWLDGYSRPLAETDLILVGLFL